MITIINYGCGNIKAIQNVLNKLLIDSKVANCVDDLINTEKLILPGVGAFDFAMQKLIDSGMKEKLNEIVLEEKKPVLGICVGAQLMAKYSQEGVLNGLGWINVEVKKFQASKFKKMKNLPHMGWNDVYPTKSTSLFNGIENEAKFYFLHSYYLACNDNDLILAKSDYDGEFTCAVNYMNIYGVQFHPEKSHKYGVKLLENFAKFVE